MKNPVNAVCGETTSSVVPLRGSYILCSTCLGRDVGIIINAVLLRVVACHHTYEGTL